MMTAYRWLLLVFPAAFRRRFGCDMADVFADRWKTARAAGWGAAVVMAGRTFIDTVRHGVAERRAARLDRQGPIMATFSQDVRYALRTFRRRPGFTAVALITLALGVGANTAIFSVFHAVLLRGLPFPDAERLVRIYGTHTRYGFDHGVISPFDYDVWERRTQTLERLSAVRSISPPDNQFYPWLMGMRRAMELMLTGDSMSGAEAAAFGFANRAYPVEELEARVLDVAGRVAKIPSDLQQINKRAVHRQMEAMGLRAGIRAGTEMQALAMSTETTRTWLAQLRDKGLNTALTSRDATFGDGRTVTTP